MENEYGMFGRRDAVSDGVQPVCSPPVRQVISNEDDDSSRTRRHTDQPQAYGSSTRAGPAAPGQETPFHRSLTVGPDSASQAKTVPPVIPPAGVVSEGSHEFRIRSKNFPTRTNGRLFPFSPPPSPNGSRIIRWIHGSILHPFPPPPPPLSPFPLRFKFEPPPRRRRRRHESDVVAQSRRQQSPRTQTRRRPPPRCRRAGFRGSARRGMEEEPSGGGGGGGGGRAAADPPAISSPAVVRKTVRMSDARDFIIPSSYSAASDRQGSFDIAEGTYQSAFRAGGFSIDAQFLTGVAFSLRCFRGFGRGLTALRGNRGGTGSG